MTVTATVSRPDDSAGPGAGLSRADQLISPHRLAAVLGPEAMLATAEQTWRIVEVGYGTLPAFLTGHLPGAAYIDTVELECPPLWNKVSDAALTALLLHHGIRHDTTVVVYGRNNLAAARAAHLMLYAGVADVRLLDGGFHAWRARGLPLVAGPARPRTPARDFGIPVPAHPEYLVDLDQARALQRGAGPALVSVRTWNEHVGVTSGYAYIAARGDIPGALWGRIVNDDDINGMTEFHDADGSMAPARIRAIWAAAQIDAARHTVFYCGTGWRASLAFFYAWLMGWERISVFDGGWYEWSLDAANPVICRTDGAAT